jgi:hypothetical protein
MISVKAYVDEVVKGLSELEREAVPRAAQQALNRVAPTVRTHTVRSLQSELKLKNQAALRGAIVVVKAQKLNLTAEVKTTDRSIRLDESRNTLVRVTRKRIPGKKGTRKHTSVLFKAKRIEGLIQIDLAVGRRIVSKEPGRYKSGKKNQRVALAYAWTMVQELFKAEVDKQQEKVGVNRFEIEFDRSLENALRKLRFA